MCHYFEEKGGWAGLKSAIILIICALSIGCSRSDVNKPVLGDSVRMNAPGYSIGVPQGAAAMTVVEKRFPKCRIEYFGSLNDGYLAVKHRKIDAFAFDKHTLQYVILQNPDLAVMDEKIADESIVAGAAMGRQDLIDKVNTFIRQYRADGTYKDMYRRWLLKEGKGMPLLPEPKNPGATLRIGTEGLNEPMNYYADGLLTGFDIEFARRLGIFLNTKVTFHTMEFSALVPAVETGKIDLLIAGLNATDGTKKEDPYVRYLY